MLQSEKDFFEDVAKLAEGIKSLAGNALPLYRDFAEDVIAGRITDITEIERNLDYMLSYCFDDRILSLYKKVLGKLHEKYPDVVKFYVDAYHEMYEE